MCQNGMSISFRTIFFWQLYHLIKKKFLAQRIFLKIGFISKVPNLRITEMIRYGWSTAHVAYMFVSLASRTLRRNGHLPSSYLIEASEID